MKKPIATPSRTKEILETHGMFAKKNYGQNFLIESGIVDKIARHAVLSDHCVVFEIGPGIGALTQYLCEYAKKVVSFEIDERLPDVLADTLQEYDNFELVMSDFLEIDLKECAERTGKRAMMSSLLPICPTISRLRFCLKYLNPKRTLRQSPS